MIDAPRSRVRRDYLDAEGALELRKRIETFWAAKGGPVPQMTLVLKIVHARPTVELKSDMVDGLPK